MCWMTDCSGDGPLRLGKDHDMPLNSPSISEQGLLGYSFLCREDGAGPGLRAEQAGAAPQAAGEAP